MDLLTESFKKFITANHLFTIKDHLLLAVSGGVDSVALCELCHQCGFEFSIAHCNFQLRGEESDGDESFVRELAQRYAVPFFVERFDTATYAAQEKKSIQVAARELRYAWFQQLLQQAPVNLHFILTAHHADDNIETILMNFFKGSGINGLKGILPRQQDIMRPLLFASKQDIEQYATQRGLSYREDSSNNSDKYTRNYFRNQLIPGLQKVFPQVKENLLNNVARFQEINCIYNNAMEQIKSKLLFPVKDELHIPVLKLQKTEGTATILYEIIKDYGFTAHQGKEVMKLLNSESGKYVQSASHRILRNRKWMIISKLDQSMQTIHLLEKGQDMLPFEAGKLVVKQPEKIPAIHTDQLVAQLDSSKIEFPLLIRKWKTGDYFYPLGMKKKKKLSRFFIDQKLSLQQKQQVWVVESNKKIVWIIGHRIDDRCKITDSTTGILSLRLEPSGQTS
ncbi:MAG: tRNA lysidine(34) synthetase TilS [Chitinophagaceae bacterium]|nr:MAG: tRNA lysidine(34) synthetase TilS [Chitinophagaceae bacterium]